MKKAFLLILVLAFILSLAACSGTKEVNNFAYTLSYGEQMMPGTYSGDIADDLPNGQGAFLYDDGETTLSYAGGWLYGKFSIEGHLKINTYTIAFQDGVIRTGEFDGDVVDGVASGFGSFTTENDDGITYTYTGEWKNGTFNGYGTMKFGTDGYNVFAGDYTDGDYTPTPGVSRILCKLKNAVQIEQIYSKGAARKSAVPFAVILAVNLPYVKDQ